MSILTLTKVVIEIIKMLLKKLFLVNSDNLW